MTRWSMADLDADRDVLPGFEGSRSAVRLDPYPGERLRVVDARSEDRVVCGVAGKDAECGHVALASAHVHLRLASPTGASG
jgi:hypothetical protein